MSDTPDVSARCPIGLEHAHGLCSYISCWGCIAERNAVQAAIALTAQAERIAELEAGGEKLRNFAWKVGSMSEKRLPTWKWASLQDQARALLEEKTS